MGIGPLPSQGDSLAEGLQTHSDQVTLLTPVTYRVSFAAEACRPLVNKGQE